MSFDSYQAKILRAWGGTRAQGKLAQAMAAGASPSIGREMQGSSLSWPTRDARAAAPRTVKAPRVAARDLISHRLFRRWTATRPSPQTPIGGRTASGTRFQKSPKGQGLARAAGPPLAIRGRLYAGACHGPCVPPPLPPDPHPGP